MADFEADLEPGTFMPRVRFNFANGWSASILIHTRPSGKGLATSTAAIAGLAACPTGKWGTGATELGEQEASADEVVAFLAAIAARPG